MIQFHEYLQQSSTVIVQSPKEMIGGPAALEFNTLIRDLSEKYSTVIVDLSSTSIMNSSGLGMLVSAHTTLTKLQKRFVLCNVPNSIVKLLSMTKLDSIFDISATVESAL